MIIRCAWCKHIIGDKPPYGGKWDREITDSICNECLKKHFGMSREELNHEAQKKQAPGNGISGSMS